MSKWRGAGLVLGIGFIVSLLGREFLPSDRYFSLIFGETSHLIPFNRFAFWLCLAVAAIIAVVLVSKRGTSP